MNAAAAGQPQQQLPTWAKAALVAVAIPLFLAAVALAPVAPVQPYLDFQVLYHADMGLLRGIPVYNYAGQVQMIAQLAGVAPEQVSILPFPYPPWYALLTAWLAWLPIESAARIWFGINLLLLFASIILLTEGWRVWKRVAAFALGFFFLPVLGSLLVGQYGFPSLLGAALMVHGLGHRKPRLVALAAALLTFKPHLGGLLVLAVLIHLWQRRDAFSRQAMLNMLLAGVALCGIGFLADPGWPIGYARSLLGFQRAADVPSCALCAGLPAILATRILPAQGLRLGMVIGAVFFIALAAFWAWRRTEIIKPPLALLAATSLVVLLVSPYLLNYDFLLLLVPLAFLAGQKQGLAAWLALGTAYLLPFLAVGLLGRQGNFAFSLSAILLMAMLYQRTQSLDVSPPAA